MSGLELYTYFRSSAAYRVRIALALKCIDYRPHYVNLLLNEHNQPETGYKDVNPQALLPALVVDATALTQSLAILEYLEECYPEPSLLPKGPLQRAQARALAQLVCCDIHPLNNLRVLNYLKEYLGVDKPSERAWYHHWIAAGLQGLECLLQKQTSKGNYCMGDRPGMADVCLIPQVYNAHRFECPMQDYPIINAIYAQCMSEPAFQQASPDRQGDAVG